MKTNCIKRLGYCNPQVDLLEKDLGQVSTPHFVYDVSRKNFLMLPDQISLSACLFFVRYWSICVL